MLKIRLTDDQIISEGKVHYVWFIWGPFFQRCICVGEKQMTMCFSNPEKNTLR